jgi:hypothetical protein
MRHVIQIFCELNASEGGWICTGVDLNPASTPSATVFGDQKLYIGTTQDRPKNKNRGGRLQSDKNDTVNKS